MQDIHLFDIAQANDFLNLWFGYMPAEHLTYLFSVPENRAAYFRGSLESPPSNIDLTQNVYFGVCSTLAEAGPGRRPGNSAINGVPGLWLDVDIAGEGHKKANLPANRDEALEQLNILGIEPSIVIDSGRGFHGYWRFNEYFEIATEADRAKIAQLSKQFQATVRGASQNLKGWTVDATQDLARVLRLPGSTNTKTPEHLPCKLVSKSGAEYDIDDLTERLNSLGGQAEFAPRAPVAHSDEYTRVDFDLNAGVDGLKLRALLVNFPKLEKTFDGVDIGASDNSPSARDFRLAHAAVRADWSDQEIIALLLAHRRNTGADLKLDRKSDCYYSRTVHKVRVLIEEKPHIDADHVARQAPEAVASDWQLIRDSTGIDIRAVEKHGERDSVYYIKVNEGERLRTIKIGIVESLRSYTKFANAIINGLSREPRKIDVKSGAWATVCSAIINIMVEVEHDTSPVWQTHAWVSSFMGEGRGKVHDNLAIAIKDNNCFRKTDDFGNTFLYLHGPTFQNWLATFENVKSSRNDLRALLAEAGFQAVKVNTPMSIDDFDPNAYRPQKRYYRKLEADFLELLNSTPEGAL